MEAPPSFMDRVDAYVLEHLAIKDLLSLLSEQLNLSKTQIYRKIKHKTGVSPSIYIRQKRLAIAHQWLLDTDLTISEIAHAVGFQRLSYFSRCFYLLTLFGDWESGYSCLKRGTLSQL